MSNLSAGKLLIPYSRLARNKITKYSGPQGRIDRIRDVITELMRKERVEIPSYVGFETRQYAERLIDLAKKYGDKHEGMMEMADYWLLEKDLVPKLFQVIVPRFQNKLGPFTLVHKLPVEYPGGGQKRIVLELKDNQLPKIKTLASTLTESSFDNSLTNVLIKSLKLDYKFNDSNK